MNEVVTRDQRREELAQTEFTHGSQGGALMNPRNGRELMDMANMMAQSGQMVREFYRGNPGDCAALIMICQPYGFNPFMVSWKTYKASKNADAPISFEGQLVNAMVNQSAPVKGRLKYTYDGDGDSMTCTVVGVDRETGDEITYTSPPVKSIPIKNSPLWKADPQQQLGYYSARSWARRHFPELLLGVYTREEIAEAPIKDVTPGRFSQVAKLAREAEQEAETIEPEPEEAEILPDEPEDLDLSEAFPGSDEFTEGVKAFQAGMKQEHCPDDYSAEQRRDWLGGWHQAAEA